MAGHPTPPSPRYRCYLSVLAGFTGLESWDPTITAAREMHVESGMADRAGFEPTLGKP